MEKIESNLQTPEDLDVLAGELTAQQKAGMQLARTLLWMIAGVILMYALFFIEHGCNQPRAPALPGASALHSVCHSCHRQLPELEFAFSNFQYVLNVLLPILGTVLGYIFGTRTRG
ncbi:hypothetical protein [Chitinophaga sp.]|uniref:hypothetical protein n=1 Tax=Chitinophaga sp. TaxID=1869181 RepID=UPI0026285EA5|nr:hypothetical protein [uncultured Chitinophaga sp.]